MEETTAPAVPTPETPVSPTEAPEILTPTVTPLPPSPTPPTTSRLREIHYVLIGVILGILLCFLVTRIHRTQQVSVVVPTTASQSAVIASPSATMGPTLVPRVRASSQSGAIHNEPTR